MSKKTRKKSSKGSPKTSAKVPAKTSALKAAKTKAVRRSPKAPVKAPAANPRKVVARKSGKSTKITLTKASREPASKTSRSGPSAATKVDPKAVAKSVAKPGLKPVLKPVLRPGLEPVSKAVAKTAAKSVAKPVVKPALVSGTVEGAMAPGFRLPRDGGDTVSLADYAGQKLVMFFYPRADTPGCTREAIDFTRLRSAFADSGTAVLGVSADTVKAQESFRNKHELSIPLISDERHEMLEAYGAWGEKSMYGRSFLGIIRTTVLIGADGKMAKIWRNVRVDGHADEVLATVRAM